MAQKPRILCLDGGGIRGLSEILILKELMLQVRMQNGLDSTPEPRQCFDFICGTSTGGLLAVLLGRLDCTLGECEALYREFGSEIFSGGSLQKLFTGSKHASAGLAKVVRQKAGEQMMYEADSVENPHVPVAVVAVSRSTRDDYLFRTYGVRSSVEPCSIVDACLATSAATTFFPPVTINGVEYIDGAFQKNNPSSAAISEVESDEWPSPIRNAVAEVTCLVSIGTGQGSFEYKRSSLRDMFVPKGLVSMKEAAKMCVAITMDCHKEHLNVRSRFEKAGRIESYYRFNVDNGLEKIELDESDDKAQQHLSAVTKSYLTREATQLKRCASLISPKRATNVDAAAQSSFPGLLCSSTPDITDEFVGRESEILQLRESLDPGQPGRRSVLLCGMGGTGKTQLALRHIWTERARYSAIVWINLWTSHHSNMSLREAHDTMNSSWPPDLPITHRNGEGDANALARVVARLRSTRYRNWLLVLDSAENLDQAGLTKYIPSCPHGSILITSTRRHAFSGSHPLQVINLDGLDTKTSTGLLLKLAHCPSLSESDETIAAKTIAKELGGIPLALEQAAGLIREGEFSFSTFLGQYRNEYRRLMAVNPSDELWSYDKNRVILTILDMAHRSLDSECAILLEYIGVLGSWPIPLSVLEQSLFVDDQANSAPGDVARLRKILSEPHYLRLSLRRLAKFCLIGLKEVNCVIKSVTIHRILCSWSLDNMVSSNKEVLLVMATYSLGKEALMGLTPTTVRLSSLVGEIPVNRKSIAAFKDCFSTMQDNSSIRKDLDPATERFRVPISQILRFAAWVATALGNSDKAKILFSSAIDFEIYRLSLEEKLWPEGTTALELLCGLSRACKKTGDLGEATEALESALPLSEELYGDGSDIVVTLVSFLKNISEKQETMLRHHKAIVIASTDLSVKRGPDKNVRSAKDVNEDHRRMELHAAARSGNADIVRLLLTVPSADKNAKDRYGETPLHHAAWGGHEVIVRLLVTEFGADKNAKDRYGETALHHAAWGGHEVIVRLLVTEFGADKNSKGRTGVTPLHHAAWGGHEVIVRLLVTEFGADKNSKGRNGVTPLHHAAWGDHEVIVRLLVTELGADKNAKDSSGETPLYYAAWMGHEGIVSLLIELGADTDAENAFGDTPLDVAIKRGHKAIIMLLK